MCDAKAVQRRNAERAIIVLNTVQILQRYSSDSLAH